MKKYIFSFLGTTLIFFFLVRAICINLHMPFIFYPIRYDVIGHLALLVLSVFLNFFLTLTMIFIEWFYKKFLINKIKNTIIKIFYFTGLSWIVLFVFTLFAGFIESGYDPFFYYGFLSSHTIINTFAYIFSAYFVTFLSSVFFSLSKMKQE